MSATISVLRPGLLTTVQDGGRWGWQAEGVPVAGAMDLVSHRLANVLAGNPPTAATLEVTLQGPVLEFHDDRRVAVCGAAFEVRVDDVLQGRQPIDVRAGARLQIGRPTRGARAYVAVSGGIEVPLVLGSRSTHVATRMGGVAGRPLRQRDTLALGEPPRKAWRLPDGWQDLVRVPEGQPVPIRVIPGPDLERFAGDAMAVLQSAPYEVTPESDRMGYRLRGQGLPPAAPRALLSEGMVHGALQVPAGGQPILLTADRQTTGGYPKVAVVVTVDLPLVGQLAPGDSVVFVPCDRARAGAALLAQERRLLALESRGSV